MNAKVSLLFGCMSLVALAACALADDKPAQKRKRQLVAPRAELPAVTATKPASNFPVIGYLEKRGRTITIKAGPKGPVYSAKTTEGKPCLKISRWSNFAPKRRKFMNSSERRLPAALGRPVW